jgi:acetylornithine deacetylase
MIDWIADRLYGVGARVDIHEDETGTKANLFATIGPEVDGGIVLSGHTDVVPVEGQAWTDDPFHMQARDDRLYGRGACDMKGFIAATLALAPSFARATLAKPLHLAFTYDEETGCFGARALAEELRRSGLRPAVAVIGEPTEMRVIEGHKGCYEYSVEFTGLPGHASLPEIGVNAVEYAVRYVARLMELRPELRARAPEGSRFEPPWTTVQVGQMSGGVARNVIAEHCVVDWEMRPVQKSDSTFVKAAMSDYVDRVLRPEMRAVFPGADIVTRVIGEVDGLEPLPESEALRIVSELTGANGADVVSFGTEAGIYQDLGISTVVCGPGSIEQAHKADEYVSLDQLTQALAMIEGLGRRLSAA